mgnify:CR=1 FL=1
MQVPVVHAGSVLPVLDDGSLEEVTPDDEGGDGDGDGEGLPAARRGQLLRTLDGGHVRRVRELDYDVTWVELIEMDGVAPYTYSEELPYDDLLQQHTPGVQERGDDDPKLVIAVLPRADSPSADRYVAEREGETAWTMHLSDAELTGTDKIALPNELANQIGQREHVSAQAASVFDPNARAWDEDLPANYIAPSLDE